jgi:DNA-binding NarL/FixJ family response regulator
VQYRIIIFEDNNRLRKSLEMLLGDDPSFIIAGAYPHCDDAAGMVQEQKAHLALMDIDMPGIGGVEGVKQIKSVFPDVKVVMHTVFDDDNRIFDSICAGADGYLLKNISPVKLVQALHDVMNGEVPMSPFVAQKVFQHFRNAPAQPEEQFNLSKREKEILKLLTEGNSYKMIAGKTSISVDTVRKHLQNIYHKLHVSCGTEAVAKALKHKIVSF